MILHIYKPMIGDGPIERILHLTSGLVYDLHRISGEKHIFVWTYNHPVSRPIANGPAAAALWDALKQYALIVNAPSQPQEQ